MHGDAWTRPTLQFYADAALLTSADDLQILLDLVSPLCHLRFLLIERPPPDLYAFLSLPGGYTPWGLIP